jgi:Raf kinase inhibitor-like YbhB/YbcL family protein
LQLASSAFSLTAERFQSGGEVPREFTCDGPNASPGLIWTEPPAATRSFALILEEQDASPHAYVRWIVYDIPASARLREARPKRAELIDGARQGINDSQGLGYSGPCPPPGRTARYVFKLYALDTKLELKAPVTTGGLEQRMKGHISGQAELTGFYTREQ